MLEKCAPGHTRKERTHNWLVTFGDAAFPALPKGEHGRRTNPDIQVGVVKQMSRQLGILDCAKRVIETLR